MNVDFSVRLDHEQSIEADCAGHIRADDCRNASDLAPTARAVVFLPFLPVEELGAAIQGLAHACGCDFASRAILRVGDAEQGAVRRGIDFPDDDFVHAELSCGPADQRLEHRRALHAARTPLRAAGRRIGGDRKAAEPQRHRLIEERRD